MKTTAILGLIVAWSIGFGFFGTAPAQDDSKQEKKAEAPVTEETIAALKEAIDGLGDALKARSAVDIVHYSKAVGDRYVGGDAAARSAAVKALKRVLKSKEQNVKTAAVSALSKTGGNAAKILMAETKKAKKNVSYLCECLRAAGKLKDVKQIDGILKFLNHKDNVVIAQAVSSLGDYSDAPTGARKDIVDPLLKYYSSTASAGTKANPRTSDKQKYEALYNTFESTLRALTKNTEITGANNWARWYRKEGKKKKEW